MFVPPGGAGLEVAITVEAINNPVYTENLSTIERTVRLGIYSSFQCRLIHS